MSDKDQSNITKEKQGGSKRNENQKKRRKELLFMSIIIVFFLADLLSIVTIGFSFLDIIIEQNSYFLENTRFGALEILIRILFLGIVNGVILILFKYVMELFFKKR